MITQSQFDSRVTALWSSQKSIGREKKWHTGKRAGMVRKAAAAIMFTKLDLGDWLWRQVGLNAVLCPYCSAPIDILSLTLDHIMPRSAGGEFTLANMQVVCADCNASKGDLTHEAFVQILTLARSLSRYDRGKLLSKLKASHHGSAQRFFRDKSGAPAHVAPLPKQPGLDLEMGQF
jgi:5-methylcytosine-specific restriction endonuclease McrA